MNPVLYYGCSAVLSALVLCGLFMQSRVKAAIAGNLVCVGVMGFAILLTLAKEGVSAALLNPWLWCAMAVGGVVGVIWASHVKMIEMPQAVALLNGIGGLASALVGGIELMKADSGVFSNFTAALALVIGMMTFSGSLIAAGKLARIIDGKPRAIAGHGVISVTLLAICCVGVILGACGFRVVSLVLCGFGALAFGTLLAMRVGGADMPVAISLLNALSGVAGAIAGMAIYNVLLVAIGGIVGSSGLLLTQIMCRAMNRKLPDILLGKTVKQAEKTKAEEAKPEFKEELQSEPKLEQATFAAEIEPQKPEKLSFSLKNAKSVIIVPGYGMALSQAQYKVKELCDKLETNGTTVRFAIHPVAGRMPGHMNVLLAEADVDYDYLFELDAINEDFRNVDAAIVVGASDVMNPAAREAEGTPIYGMPILNVDEAPEVIICNFDLKPGYAGVENPLYRREQGLRLLLGDAKDSLQTLIDEL
ncbi:MAG: NAD(P)(+) transhydrogenase (Re/Si-specific) subunit beta [Clostridia bacterium]|nr:NAD(P)(+) transhydrogenase (Re/Si-specific) subunit beta [Clostridia bacterium]